MELCHIHSHAEKLRTMKISLTDQNIGIRLLMQPQRQRCPVTCECDVKGRFMNRTSQEFMIPFFLSIPSAQLNNHSNITTMQLLFQSKQIPTSPLMKRIHMHAQQSSHLKVRPTKSGAMDESLRNKHFLTECVRKESRKCSAPVQINV